MNIPQKFGNKERGVFIWSDFFSLFGNKNDVILDFGCGPAWSIYTGPSLGYNIRGVDIDNEFYPNEIMNPFREEIGVLDYVDIYDGFNIPYLNNSFDLIVCKASFDKFQTSLIRVNEDERDELVNFRLTEFSRILRGNKTLVIAGGMKGVNRSLFENYEINVLRWRFRTRLREIQPDYFRKKFSEEELDE